MSGGHKDFIEILKEIEELLEEEARLNGSGLVANYKHKEPKCECGAEKCGTTHSTWCPKYEG
jgi:hypothetical protein